MSNLRRIMWNGTVRALPLKQQLEAARIAGCDVLALTPSDYVRWLGSGTSTRDMKAMASDAGVRLAHLDPFVRWVDRWQPDLPDFPTDAISFDADDFFRFAAALEVESFTAWGGFPSGRYGEPEHRRCVRCSDAAGGKRGATLLPGIHPGIRYPRPAHRLEDRLIG